MFYVEWGVDAQPNIELPITSYYCRDATFYALARAVQLRYASRSGTSAPGLGSIWYPYCKWLQQHEADLHVSCKTGFDNVNESDLVERVRTHTIPRTIEKLRNKFPTVRFSAIQHSILSNGFGDNITIDCIQLDGDLNVIPAFYWSTLLIRYGKFEADWKDVNKLLERSRDSSHLAEWERLRANDRIPAWYMLGVSQGPLNSRSTFHRLRNNQHLFDAAVAPEITL